jgi:hypothetical protein
MKVKFNPKISAVVSGATTSVATINFPGFQEILDFTSVGSESTVSVTVDGDTDKEYIICVFNLSGDTIDMKLNNDGGAVYGRQGLDNAGGSISAFRNTGQTTGLRVVGATKGLGICRLLTPSSLVKVLWMQSMNTTSGTTVYDALLMPCVYNSTSNITSLYFYLTGGGNFTAGTRITVYARRA